MDQLIADCISRMGFLALPIAILVAVKAGRMINQFLALNMETQVADLTIEALKEGLQYQLEILLSVYSNTTLDGNLPPEINLQRIIENLVFPHDPIPDQILFLNEIYLDLVNQSTQSEYFAQVLQFILGG